MSKLDVLAAFVLAILFLFQHTQFFTNFGKSCNAFI